MTEFDRTTVCHRGFGKVRKWCSHFIATLRLKSDNADLTTYKFKIIDQNHMAEIQLRSLLDRKYPFLLF
jgi:hypothetical protein